MQHLANARQLEPDVSQKPTPSPVSADYPKIRDEFSCVITAFLWSECWQSAHQIFFFPWLTCVCVCVSVTLLAHSVSAHSLSLCLSPPSFIPYIQCRCPNSVLHICVAPWRHADFRRNVDQRTLQLGSVNGDTNLPPTTLGCDG